MKPESELSDNDNHGNVPSTTKLMEVALEKSKSAVSRDCGDGNKVSLLMYTEAVDALQQVLDDDSDQTRNKSRLKSIQESYLKRIEFLSSSLNMKNNYDNQNRSLISTKRLSASKTLLNVATTSPTSTKTAAIMLSSVFSINKRLSNPRPQQVKQTTHSRKPSFFNIKPSVSTPSTATRRKNNDGNTTKGNNGNPKNRYSSDFTSNGTPQVVSKDLVVIDSTDTSTTCSSPTLPSFDNFLEEESSPVKQNYCDLETIELNEEEGKENSNMLIDERSHLKDELECISNGPNIRHSTDSESTVISSKAATAIMGTTSSATPPNHEPVLLLNTSNSDSTVHDDSTLSASATLSETNHHQTILEEEIIQDEINNTVEYSQPTTINTAFSSRAPRKTPSIASSNHTIELVHPMEKSMSTSSIQSLQRTFLGRKKSSKKPSKSELNDSKKKLASTTEEVPRTVFASYLQTTTKYNKKVAPASSTVDLGCSKSKKKWSIATNTGKIPPIPSTSFLDPITFLSEPTTTSTTKDAQPSSTPDNDSTQQRHIMKSDTLASLALMNTLLETMLHGARITPNLHIPMDLWYQTNVRLPATDAKIAACELLLFVLERMDKRKNFNDSTAIENDLKVLEQTLIQIKFTLIKKLGLLNNGENDSSLFDNNSQGQSPSRYSNYLGSLLGGSSGIKTSQTFSAWSSKLSKSVERMKSEASRAIPNGDQNDVYIKTLIRLFTIAKVLEKWNKKLTSIIESESCPRPLLYKRAFNTNDRCTSLLKATVCQFVLKDYESLLDKWLKRSMDWMND